MKKTKIINLMLLTVSFAASAKITTELAANKSAAPHPPLYTIPQNMGVFSQQESLHEHQDASVTRGGFGDDKHDGAEQSHSTTDEKK